MIAIKHRVQWRTARRLSVRHGSPTTTLLALEAPVTRLYVEALSRPVDGTGRTPLGLAEARYWRWCDVTACLRTHCGCGEPL